MNLWKWLISATSIFNRRELIKLRLEYRQLMNAINKELDKWDEYNLESNEINMYKQMIEEFYQKTGKNPKNRDRFSTRIKLSAEDEEEFADIAISFGLSPLTNVDTYINMYDLETADLIQLANYDKPINIDAFMKMKEQYDEYFENVQDYIHFFDRINSFKDDKLLSSILSSHQYVSLMNYGSEDIDENELDSLITEMYYKTGEEGENLYNIILEMIS